VTAAVHALLTDSAAERSLAAGFEEEGVPLLARRGSGDALSLAQDAASSSPLGIGIGADSRSLVLALASWPDVYLEAEPHAARAFGRSAARLAARRPI